MKITLIILATTVITSSLLSVFSFIKARQQAYQEDEATPSISSARMRIEKYIGGIAAAATVLAGIAGFAGGIGAGGKEDIPRAAPSPLPIPAVDMRSHFRISFPHDDTVVERCVTVRGTGQAPSGYTLIIGVRDRGIDDRIYFDPRVSYDNGTWSSKVILGAPEDIGREFEVLTILMDKHLAKYLASTNSRSAGYDSWWESSEIPPGARIVSRISISRGRQDKC
jgi:hypothetical protein